MSMYLVEISQYNRLVKVKSRSPDYDVVLAAFNILKRGAFREVRFVVVRNGERAILKYMTRGRSPTSTVLKSIANMENVEHEGRTEAA